MKKHLRGTPAHEERKAEMAARRAKYHAQPAPKPRSTIKFDKISGPETHALLAAVMGSTAITGIQRRAR